MDRNVTAVVKACELLEMAIDASGATFSAIFSPNGRNDVMSRVYVTFIAVNYEQC